MLTALSKSREGGGLAISCHQSQSQVQSKARSHHHSMHTQARGRLRLCILLSEAGMPWLWGNWPPAFSPESRGPAYQGCHGPGKDVASKYVTLTDTALLLQRFLLHDRDCPDCCEESLQTSAGGRPAETTRILSHGQVRPPPHASEVGVFARQAWKKCPP